jgi:gamma-glutamylcyclotransferase (GGCT)/AIG2-like uncharacterized protein YtfP
LVIADESFIRYLIDEPGARHHVEGELYRVDDAVLAELDELESIHLPNGEIEVAPLEGSVDAAPTTAWRY